MHFYRWKRSFSIETRIDPNRPERDLIIDLIDLKPSEFVIPHSVRSYDKKAAENFQNFYDS